MKNIAFVVMAALLAVMVSFMATPCFADDENSEQATAQSGTSVAASDTEDAWGSLPEELLLDSKSFKSDYEGAVPFSHKKHNIDYGVRCAICHHFQDSDPDPAWNCSDCHDPVKKIGAVVRLSDAFHNNCRDCHQAAVESGKSTTAPYLKCTDCHQAKE